MNLGARILLILALLAPSVVFAQTTTSPTLILTWQAHSYLPAGYQGKALPPRDSTVDVYLEFLDGGKITPLTNQVVRWQVNKSFVAAGNNLTRLSFPLDKFTTKIYTVTATVKEYNGADYEKTIVINRTDPLVVVRNEPFRKDAAGTHANLTAEPYFFSSANPSDYLFNWIVNEITAGNRLGRLTLTVPPAAATQALKVSVDVTNRNNEIESAQASAQFIISN